VTLTVKALMNLFNAALRGLGASAIVVTLIAPGQARPSQPKPLQVQKPLASTLGGPITPSDPNLFLGSGSPILQPVTLQNQASEDGSPFKAPPLRSGSPKPITPMVGDPPRQSGGGFINFKTD
jgi:hypothetical protein